MGLYQKHRPKGIKDIVGNSNTREEVQEMLESNEVPHAILLTGDTGCGKTTIARIIGNHLADKDEYIEIDSADFRGIDMVREIRKRSAYRPMKGENRVWLIDECHKLTGDAQNALLKILEDTPKHVYFILATTEPQKLIKTIKGRCSQLQVEPLTEVQMKKLIKKTCRAEGEQLEDEVVQQIAQDSFGRPREALQILEQVLRVSEDKRLSTAKRSAEKQSEAIELCRMLIKRASWNKVSTILEGIQQEEPESIRRMVLAYCKSILLKNDNPVVGLIMEQFIEPFYNTGFPGLVFACYMVHIEGEV